MKTFAGRSLARLQSQCAIHVPSGEKLPGTPSATVTGAPAALGGVPPSSRTVMIVSAGGLRMVTTRRPSRLQSSTITREPAATASFPAFAILRANPPELGRGDVERVDDGASVRRPGEIVGTAGFRRQRRRAHRAPYRASTPGAASLALRPRDVCRRATTAEARTGAGSPIAGRTSRLARAIETSS